VPVLDHRDEGTQHELAAKPRRRPAIRPATRLSLLCRASRSFHFQPA
jgi:hypothetical protein